MTRWSLLALVVLGTFAAAASAQAPPNFSGRWTLEAPAIATTAAVPGTPATAAAPGDMGSGWGSPLTITQTDKELLVEYAVFSRYDLQPPLVFSYPLDGTEGRNTVNLGRGDQTESSRAEWNGGSLIITTTFAVNDRAAGQPFTAQMTRKLSLESPGTMIVEVTRAGVLGGPASTTRSVYRTNPE